MYALCPCDSNKPYAQCCEPYLAGKQVAPTPETLMRSRYTAFVKRKFSYLMKTMQGEAAKSFDIAAVRRDAPLIQWLKLEVIRADTQDDLGVVEFKAYFRYRNAQSVLHEVSQFAKVAGEWFYISGIVAPV